MDKSVKLIIGGGAAGFFGAINLAMRGDRVILIEKNKQLLSKVKISGGGRCNATHACFDPKELIKNYPRGSKALLGPFYKFGPTQTIEWFSRHGVELKIEEDKRMFPTSNSSQTIIDCFMNTAKELGVEIRTNVSLASLKPCEEGLEATFESGEVLQVKSALFATGSSTKMWEMLKTLGHTIVEPVASLFTINTPSSPFLDLAGISLPFAKVYLENGMSQEGPMLFTHWGLSGPCVLKLSAWAARAFHEAKYFTNVFVDFAPQYSDHELGELIDKKKQDSGSSMIRAFPLIDLPRRLWDKIMDFADLKPTQVYAQMSTRQKKLLISTLKKFTLFMEGKTTYKDEFVTCGGVLLDEVDFQTMQSKKVKGLYFAGEVLDIDGITGGFNFQAAWTTSFIASQHM